MSEPLWRALRVTMLATLILWGGYTLLVYVGLPVHQLVLLEEGERNAIQASCGGESVLCMAMKSFGPFITHTVGRLSPLSAFFFVSLLFYAGVLGWQAMKSGEWRARFDLTPWKLLLLFTAAVWVFFTIIPFVDNDGHPIRRIFEPLPQVYVNAGAEALEALQKNYMDLEDAGCLRFVGETDHGAKVQDVKTSCLQTSFFTRVLPQLALLLLLFFEMLVLGRAIMRGLRVGPVHPIAETAMSAGLGACGLMLILWLLAIASSYTTTAGWLILAVIPAACWIDSRYWAEKFLFSRWRIDEVWYAVAPILGWFLISYLALNFLNVVRPFPIGWDDLGRYVNQPRLLVSYGHIIPTMATFQWEYLTSLGFLLFGYDSVFGATAAMEINWLAGVLAVLTTYAFGALYLGRRAGFLGSIIYYTLPVVGHFSFADMKVDNAVFAIGSLTVLATFLYLFPVVNRDQSDDENAPEEMPRNLSWIIIAGILGGFAFSMKPTSIMILMALGPVLLGVLLHWTAFFGGASLAWAVYTWQGRFDVRVISEKVFGDPSVLNGSVILSACLALGVILLGYALYERRALVLSASKAAGIFVGVFILALAPWLAYNNILYGNTVPRLMLTMPNTLSPTFSVAGETIEDQGQDMKSLPPELQIDTKHAACQSTSKSEELDRYWGYGAGWKHYLTLPWRSIMNLDAAGYYVTMVPFLLLFPLLLFLPYFWTKRGRWLRWLFAGTIFMLIQWVFFANGIPWYGIGVFLGLAVGLEALVIKSPDPVTRGVAGTFAAFSILIALGMRMWQFEQQRNVFEYAIGKVSAEAMRERTIPYYDDIRDIVMERFRDIPDRPYVYRVGTFIPYFIPKNLEVLPIADNQLDFFNCLHQERDAALTLRRMKALGYSSIIFDTNTHTIERDPNGTLHKKVQTFIDFLNTPSLGLQPIVNDLDAGVVFLLIP